jgi:hypothetical protein
LGRIQETERDKVKEENLAIFFQFPSKQFLPISFQMWRMEYFPQKQKEQRHKQLGYTDKMVITAIFFITEI